MSKRRARHWWWWWPLTSGFPPASGIPAEDFLCVPEPDEDECLSSGLDGDETSHKQVSVEGPRASIHRAVLGPCAREKARQASRFTPWHQKGEDKCEKKKCLGTQLAGLDHLP